MAAAAAASGGPSVTIEARVDVEACRIEGTLRYEGLTDALWIDPLASLPDPTWDVDQQRTFPGMPDHGAVTWTEGTAAGHPLTFAVDLPRRFGDTGCTWRGLFANGGWHPQPMIGGHLPTLDWAVHLRAGPDDHLALGGVIGVGEVRWSGHAERASLAAFRRGQLTHLDGAGWQLDLLTRAGPRPRLELGLHNQLDLTLAGLDAWQGTVVEAPLRRRLAVAGAGQAYVSDRAWRVFPWFRRLHHTAPIQAALASAAPSPDPFVRELAAAGWSAEQTRRNARRQAVNLLGLTRWIPAVDAALYDQEMAFQQELFRRAHPTDRVRDELTERLDEHGPATAAMAQLADLAGADVALDLSRRLLLGYPLGEASRAAGVDPSFFDPWRSPYPSQDYTITLDGDALTVTRQAPADALAEPVIVKVDDHRRLIEGSEGPWTHTWTEDHPPRRAVLDPDRHLAQTSRVGDDVPASLRWTLSGQIASVNVSEAFVNAFAVLTVRRSDDTFNRWRLWLFTNQRSNLATRLSYTRFFGPILRGATRQHAVSVAVDAAWLHRRFSPFGDADASVGGSLGWAWDNASYSLFPTRGSHLDASLSAGGAPQTGQTYVRARGSASTLLSLHPRHVFGGRMDLGAAWSDIPQELLSFGGASGVRGIPDDVVQTDLQAIGSIEYRLAALRNASIPLGLLYVTEIDLIAGVDVGLGRSGGEDHQPVQAIGGVFGVGVITENLGLSPGAAVLSFGVPLWTGALEMPEKTPPVAMYLTWGQAF